MVGEFGFCQCRAEPLGVASGKGAVCRQMATFKTLLGHWLNVDECTSSVPLLTHP